MLPQRLMPVALARLQSHALPAGAYRTATDSPFFRLLGALGQGTAAALMTGQAYAPGDVVFLEGESGEAMYIIESGLVAIVKGGFEMPLVLGYRGPWEVIGEMALLEDRPRVASGVALTPTRLLRVSRERFHQLLSEVPGLGLELMRTLSGRLRAAEESRQLPYPAGDAWYDPLTGVYTRLAFDARLLEEIEKARRYGHVFSLLMMDLDHFKSINDGFGHARGDEVLVEFARRLRSVIRASDLAFRYGGDEFTCLLPETGAPQAIQLAHRLLDHIRAAPFAGAPPLSLTLSVGIANFPADAQTPEALFEVADRRAYQAKRAGRGRVVSDDQKTPRLCETAARSPLIERDQALEGVHAFLNVLSQPGGRALWVSGPAGCGQTRFLAEVCALAHLWNFAVLALGSPTTAAQPYVLGALAEAQHAWQQLSEAAAGAGQPVVAALQQAVKASGRRGLVLVVDQWAQLEAGQLAFLRDLTLAPDLPPWAVVYTAETPPPALASLQISGRPVEVRLVPFSLQGVRLWLRHGLQWEAPEVFSQWLYAETGGRPAHLQRRLAKLIERGQLTLSDGYWMVSPTVYEGRP